MKDLQMPHSYAVIPEDELSSVSGGGPLGDALNLFFGNFQLGDLFFDGGLISFSVTFVPFLLFNVIKTGFGVMMDLNDRFTGLFNFSEEGSEMVQYLSERRKEERQQSAD